MATPRLARIASILGLSLVFGATASVSRADPWLAPGDLQLRHDIELLADAGILHSPIMTWPMSWPDIARDVASAAGAGVERLDGATAAALARVQRAARREAAQGFQGWELEVAGAAKPTPLRTFSDTPREEGNLAVGGSWLGERFAARLNVGVVSDPADEQELRPDGSYVGVNVGNFMISAGWMERWWGPGWDGSLILGTNARPMPTFTVERNYTDPFKSRWLSWIGPWRASLAVGQAESSDPTRPGNPFLSDVKFFAARVNFRPRPWLEFALSRSAQFCGEGRECSLSTVTDLLLGRDNQDINQQPGNQMAGYDVRVRSPWRALPAVVYLQMIGEDEAGGLPSKFLGLLGGELWGDSRWGSWRLRGEYADTTCTFTQSTPEFDCAYRNGIFPQGYTYRGRVIGHAMDNDGRMYSLAAMLVRPSGEMWSVLFRKTNLNRDGGLDVAHTLSTTADSSKEIELQYNRAFAIGDVRVGAGYDDRDSGDGEFRGFIEWRHSLQ